MKFAVTACFVFALAGQDVAEIKASEIPCVTKLRLCPSEPVGCVNVTGAEVPRLRYAIEMRDELRTMKRFCDHPEDWDKTVRAIAEGAQLVEMSVCHHDKKSRRTMYRVTAKWLQIREYPSASVVEGVERQ